MSEYVIDLSDAEVRRVGSLYGINAIAAFCGLPVHEEIVRCRDCKYFEGDYSDGASFGETVCWAWDNGHDYPNLTVPHGFCYRGERNDE